MADSLADRFRALPSVESLASGVEADAPKTVVVAAARRAVDEARRTIREGGTAPSHEALQESVRDILSKRGKERSGPVINATGVLIHTNLGRVPLGADQVRAVVEAASNYTDLEYDLMAGTRSSRHRHLDQDLAQLTGAEAAMVVNNNAAAVLLMLSGLCSGAEVIISRGELVEIGGEFRIPDIMSAAGVKLVEVGTTNRTHIADYERAISPQTAAILKVHPSNYKLVGFVTSVTARELGRLATGRKIRFLYDVGSGLIEHPDGAEWVGHEPTVRGALADGADIVTFSGDKLMGGPQAGILVGPRREIDRLIRHPLARALRVDKMTLAALGATVEAHVMEKTSALPLWEMAAVPQEQVRARAEAMAEQLGQDLGEGFKVDTGPSESVAGGGSTPGAEIPSWAIFLVHSERSSDELARSLRTAVPPIVGRVAGDRVLLDLRTVPPDRDALLAKGILDTFR